ncbi:MAG TPA: hypothetical protein VH724_17015, partial [Candidatus Angelobacter sp.]|nr:hypothetical protein [Candidatus Angelobacter sp.]
MAALDRFFKDMGKALSQSGISLQAATGRLHVFYSRSFTAKDATDAKRKEIRCSVMWRILHRVR